MKTFTLALAVVLAAGSCAEAQYCGQLQARIIAPYAPQVQIQAIAAYPLVQTVQTLVEPIQYLQAAPLVQYATAVPFVQYSTAPAFFLQPRFLAVQHHQVSFFRQRQFFGHHQAVGIHQPGLIRRILGR